MPERISRTNLMMNIAMLVGMRGTCDRLYVGAVIAREHRVIVTGYNGVPSGLTHCNHGDDPTPCQDAVHAEANTIAFAARYGISVDHAELYVTHQPCINCAKLIINSGLSEVHYLEPYRDPSGLQLLGRAGIEVIKYEREPDFKLG